MMLIKGQAKVDFMGITIKDIAQQAGVSYSTVSKALNDSPLVKPDTKLKIIEIARTLGYQPNFAAQHLVKKRTNTIGLIWPTIARTVPARLVSLIREELEKQGYTMILSVDSLLKAFDTFKRFQVDGLIIFEGVDPVPPLSLSIPIITYGIYHPNKSYLIIDANHRLAMDKAVDHLVKLGHSRLQFIGDLDSNDPFQYEKQQGFIKALEKYRLPIGDHAIINTHGLDWFNGYQAIKHCLSHKQLGRAIISGSYELSGGIVRGLKEHQYAIPEDISIIGYDNIPQMAHLEKPITSVGVSMDKLAITIVKHLINLLNDKNDVHFPVKMIPELNTRHSCARLVF